MVVELAVGTSARIQAPNQPEEDRTAQPPPYGWITALRAPAIRKLMADDGPLPVPGSVAHSQRHEVQR
jgi:hypothetical protein